MKEFFEFLITNDLTPNGHYILYCMVNGIPLQGISFTHEQYKLSLSGFLEEKIENKIISYSITSKGYLIVHEADVYICNLKTVKKVSKVDYDDWANNITIYNNMFPKGKKKGCTVSFRTNPKELYDKFKWFFTEYPEYTWEDVLDATEKYLLEFDESCDYTYAQTSKYFIKKDDKNKVTTSTLASMIYNIKEGNDEEVGGGTYYFGP
jgi:hypothetical protein